MASLEEPSIVMEDFLSLVRNDNAIASLLFAADGKGEGNRKREAGKTAATHHRTLLLQTCQQLFQNIEGLSHKLNKIEDPTIEDTTLSGLEELYLGASEEDPVDAETLWGQADLQNEALHKLLKKSLKHLGKSADGIDSERIRLLDIESEIFQDDEGEETGKEKGSSDENESEQESEDDEEVDEETRRVRERMRRAMEDQDEEDEDEEDEYKEEDGLEEDHSDDDSEDYEDTRFFGKKKSSSKKDSVPKKKDSKDNDLVDPAAEELNNGFFDISEMEAFADEEEDMLPEEALYPDLPQPKKNANKKESIHEKQRRGMESDDDDEDEEEEIERALEKAKRKKYREDDEIDALYKLYEGPDMEDEEVDDAVNMTAADFFGAPDRKYFHKWKAQQEKVPSKKPAGHKKDDDEDSWDGYNFDEEEAEWGDVPKENEDDDSDGSEDNEDRDSEDSSEEEESESEGDVQQEAEQGKTAKKEETKGSASQYAKQSTKLREETERLEAEMLSEKPWQMIGEATGTTRPVNSLLQGTPEFEVASKQAPVITVEHTADLEEAIKRRILNEDWDDVIPRELPDVAWHKKRGELPEVSQEKAKLGLGELYEREFLKKAVGYDVDAAEKQSEEEKAKNEMKQLFANICSKLDALSNYHFAPRPVAEEAEVKPATTPAIAMEEVLPLHVNDARAVAPEEVYNKKRGRDGILRNENELEQVRLLIVFLSKFSTASLTQSLSTTIFSFADGAQAHPFFQKGSPSQGQKAKG